jgi:hypothetical protein
MKKRFAVGLVFVLVVLMVLGTSGALSAKSVRTDVESVEYDCFTGFAEGGGIWQEGDVMHIRDILHTNFNFSDTPELTGVHSNVANGQINTATGHVTVRGQSTWVPEGIDGAWVGHWIWIATKDRNDTWGIFRGTGALQGKILFTDVYDYPEAPPRPDICDAVCASAEPESCYLEGTVRTDGYILEVGEATLEQTPVDRK